jgi:CheY-like chemotaxis protein
VNAATGSGQYFEWVIRLTRGQLLDLVLEIEERLRRLVRNVLQDDRNDWEKLVPESIRAVLEQQSPPSNGPADLLDQADLGQLIGIVLARWKHFEDLLGDKPTFQVKANEFRQWRNSLAHGKNPSMDEKVEIGILVRQIGRQIPVVDESTAGASARVVRGSTVLWVDDHPEWNLVERQILRSLGIEVVPVLSNDEAIDVANQRSFDLVISDIDRGNEEAGDVLPRRLQAVGIHTPVLFYVGSVDPGREPPAGGASIVDDPAMLMRDTLNLLSHHPEASSSG